MSSHKKRTGFNAIELIVVILVIFALIGVILVFFPKRRSPYRTQSVNNLKQIALACHEANDAFKRMPPAFDQYGKMTFPASLHVHLLPYIEQRDLYNTYLDKKGMGKASTDAIINVYVLPIDPPQAEAGLQNLAANLRVFSAKGMATQFDGNMPPLAGVEPGISNIPGSFPDGTSNTILFSTKYGTCKDGGSRYAAAPDSPFAAFFGQNAAKVSAHPSDPTATFQDFPTPHECLTDPLMAQSMWNRYIMIALADASVRTLDSNVSPLTWNLALQPNDGLQLGDDW
jgi:hypothetical protein